MFQPVICTRRLDWVSTETDLVVSDIVELLFRAQDVRPQHERRKDKRIAFPRLLTLTPIDELETKTVDSAVTVVGKYLASNGFDFYHCDTLPYKRVVISFGGLPGAEEDIHLVLNISWCRFLRPGWYDSAGRFTHIVQPTDNLENPKNVANDCRVSKSESTFR